MRQLAEQFRRCATETRLPSYIALLNHAADQLDLQATLLSRNSTGDPLPRHNLDIHI